MEFLKTTLDSVTDKDKTKRFIIHETKYALLAAVLFVLFLMPWAGDLVVSVFPMARGPLKVLYKAAFFFAIYFIIQKTSWFQGL
jgi:hypothetical protein